MLQQLAQALITEPVTGLSVLGISHRSKWFADVVDELEANILGLLGIARGYKVLFLQGGATQQFSMIPMTLLRGATRPAEYLQTGYWSQKAIPEAQREGPVRVLWNGQPEQYQRLPAAQELDCHADAPICITPRMRRWRACSFSTCRALIACRVFAICRRIFCRAHATRSAMR